MRTRLRKDPIESWEKMKKYLKRQFLPPDYKELLYEKYENFKQLGNFVSEFTNKFYHLRSYLDLNEPEAYNISKYMMGLRWAIRERLSSQSFYYLSDLVSAAKGIEKLMEIEKMMKVSQQALPDTNEVDVRYPVASATQNYSSNLCNPKKNASTLSSKVSGGEREYGSNMQVDFAHVIENDDYVSRREEEEPKQQIAVSTGDTVYLHRIDDQFGDDMVSASLVIKTRFEIESDAMPYHMNMILQDKSKQRVTGRFIVKVSNGIQNTNEAQRGVIANSMQPSVREGMGISSGLILFSRREMMTIYVEKHFSILTTSEYAIVLSKNKESNPTKCTALSVGRVQQLINELPESEEILQTQFIMKDMQHIINQIPVTVLADLLYSSFTSIENRNLLEHVEMLPTKGTPKGVVRKYESICARPDSAIPKNQGNWMISYLCPKIIFKNGYQETCILKESEWKTSFKPTIGFCEFLVMSTKRSNNPKMLWKNQTRKLYGNLNGYYGMIQTQQSIQELLTITIPSSGIEKLPHRKISQNKCQILFGQGKDMAGMKLINEEVNMCALLVIIMEKPNRSWRMYVDIHDVKCYIHYQDCIVGLFFRLVKYSKMSLNSPYHQIIFNHKRRHALARIHEQLVFAIGLHSDWGKCIIIPHIIVHTNDIIAEKENISAIHNLTTLANIHQEREYFSHPQSDNTCKWD